MQFRDKTLVRLSDPETRGDVFDEVALDQILSAAYDVDTLPVNAPFSAVFDRFRLGYAETYSVHGEGQLYGRHGDAGRVTLTLADWQPGQVVQADAFWRGAVIARSAHDDSVIELLDFDWSVLSKVDAAAAAANGGELPSDPRALEAARRTALVALLKDDMQSPDALTDARLDRLLGNVGAAGVSDLLENRAGRPAHLGIGFSEPAGMPPRQRRFPVAAALLIRERFAVADLLLESKLLRHRLAEAGVETPRPQTLPLRHPLLVIWVVTARLFEDEDWPGATAGMNPSQRLAARRARAGQWLAREGIGLAVVAD